MILNVPFKFCVVSQQQLELANGKNRYATHKAQRWYDTTEHAWNLSRGPHYSSDLQVHEKLDRPIIRVFQRHPGQNMPEAQEIVKVLINILCLNKYLSSNRKVINSISILLGW